MSYIDGGGTLPLGTVPGGQFVPAELVPVVVCELLGELDVVPGLDGIELEDELELGLVELALVELGLVEPGLVEPGLVELGLVELLEPALAVDPLDGAATHGPLGVLGVVGVDVGLLPGAGEVEGVLPGVCGVLCGVLWVVLPAD